MTQIKFTIPAVPVAQPRPRATNFGKRARVYSPPGPIDTFKATARLAAAQAYSGPPLEGPLRVDIEFILPRIKTQIWKRKPMPRMWHTKTPDRDNLDKGVLDSFKGLLWSDDAQVCDGRITKLIAAGNEQPHAVVTVTELDEAITPEATQ